MNAPATQVETAPAFRVLVSGDQYWALMTLAVGDEVAFARLGGGWSHSYFREECVAKVTKVTKTQVTLDNGRRFKLDGREHGVDAAHSCELWTVEKLTEVKARIAAERAARDAADALRKAVSETVPATGLVTADVKAQLLALVAALAVAPE